MESENEIIRSIDSRIQTVLIQSNGTTDIGCMIYFTYKKSFRIYSLGVDKTHQGNGYGKKFVNYLKDLSVKKDMDILIEVDASNSNLIHFYNNLGLKNDDVIWIDAIPSKVTEATNRGIPNVYNAVVTDKDDEEIIFNISNNVQSSSVLEFGTHLQEYPRIVYVDKIKQKSITIDTFFEKNNIDASKYNFWNFDIQGAELMALKGAVKSIQYAKAIYLEVNETEMYKKCGLIADIDAFL